MSTDLNRRQFASSLIAGSVAGTSTDCIFFPIDTLKTRLQAAEGFRKAGGFRHLEKGVVAVVAGSAPAAALFFGAYTLAKTELSGALPGAPDAAVHMAAAIVGEVVESVVRVPTELVKQRMQAGRHASSPAAVRDIVAASGVRGLFRGYASTLARDIPFALIQFPLYESLRQSYAERARRQPTAVEAALAGSAAGAVAAAITTPLDVAKTRIMLSQDHSTGVHVMIRRIWREEGPRRLFAGVAPRVLWISFGGFWFFGSFEMANQLLLREVFKEPRAVGDSSPDLSAPTRWRGRADSSAEGTRMRA
ncbi:hypothetical protein KFE25_011441 [Diacronema lutheri]|uniref:Uncharacterized protein n=1 Tax=Diacronema lutheri TaxID=2081491 RepID=A0A8J5X8D9_DIALT|nr:hypothetical protein KFE25_011441 [Diacronema lutheri]